jgi:hypothetical protein
MSTYRPPRYPTTPRAVPENTDVEEQRVRGQWAALSEFTKTNREILTTAREQQSANWRAAVSAVGGLERAKQSGESAALIDAAVELAKIDLSSNPVDLSLMRKLEADTMAELPGQDPTSAAFRRSMWQRFAAASPGPEMDPKTLGNLEFMRAHYAWDDSFITPEDKVAWEHYNRVVKQAEVQAAEVERMRGLKAQAQDLEHWVREHPNAKPTEVQSYMNTLDIVGDSKAMRSIADYAQMMSNAAPTLSPDERQQFDENEKWRRQIMEGSDSDVSPESDRDRMARIIAKEKFQRWAHSNGFQVGHIEPADPNGNYGAGVVTPVGVYVPGPDDWKAIKFAEKQMGRKVSEDMPWQHHRAGGAEVAPTFVEIKLKGGETWDHANQYDQYIRSLLDQIGQPQTEENISRLKTEIPESEIPASEGNTIHGQLMASRVGDPEGSVRIKGYDKPFLQDDMVGEPMVTSGGGEAKSLRSVIQEHTREVLKRREEARKVVDPEAAADAADKESRRREANRREAKNREVEADEASQSYHKERPVSAGEVAWAMGDKDRPGAHPVDVENRQRAEVLANSPGMKRATADATMPDFPTNQRAVVIRPEVPWEDAAKKLKAPKGTDQPSKPGVLNRPGPSGAKEQPVPNPEPVQKGEPEFKDSSSNVEFGTSSRGDIVPTASTPTVDEANKKQRAMVTGLG